MKTLTITVKPSPATPSKVTANSSDGYTFKTAIPLLDGARYWLNNGADPATSITTIWSYATSITTIWSSGPGHWSLRSTIGAAAKLDVSGSPPRFVFRSTAPADNTAQDADPCTQFGSQNSLL